MKVNTKITTYKEGDKVFFKNYRPGKCFWEDGIVSKRIGRVIYIVKGKKHFCKRHINEMRYRYIKTVENDSEIPMEVLYDAFQIQPPINSEVPMEVTSTPKITDFQKSKNTPTRNVRRKSDRKKKRTTRLCPNPKRKKY